MGRWAWIVATAIAACGDPPERAAGDAPPPTIDADTCSDRFELNNTVAAAKPSGISPSMHMVTLDDLTICGDGDTDVFRVEIFVEGQNLTADVAYGAAGTQLQLSMLTSTGAPAASGVSMPNNHVAVTAMNLLADVYYLKIFGPTIGQNTYALSITESGP